MSETKSSMVELSLEQIENGSLLQSINESIKNACKDAIDRCNIGKKWTVITKIELKPLPDPNNDQITYMDIDWECKMTPPGQSGTVTRGLVYKGSVHVNRTNFNEPLQDKMFDEPDQANQPLKFAKQ